MTTIAKLDRCPVCNATYTVFSNQPPSEVEKLKALLREAWPLMNHRDNCPQFIDPTNGGYNDRDKPCNCGYEQISSRIEEATKE